MNVQTQRNDPKSSLSLYRALLQLRRSDSTLTLGSYRLRSANRHVLAYERRHRDGIVLVVLNLTNEAQELRVVSGAVRHVALSTYLDEPECRAGDRIRLRADEGVVLRESS
jgi:alpha-glucosidase